MSFKGSSVDSVNDTANYQHPEAKGFPADRVSAAEEAYKEALLNPDHALHDSSSRQPWWHAAPKRVWSCLVRNIAVMALICLLVGGLITIMTSFGS